jgi:hypothetical protein
VTLGKDVGKERRAGLEAFEMPEAARPAQTFGTGISFLFAVRGFVDGCRGQSDEVEVVEGNADSLRVMNSGAVRLLLWSWAPWRICQV